jgi:hypothetical protein
VGWIVTVASPTNRSAQVTIVGNDDIAASGISVEVLEVDAVHARAVERGLEIACSLRDEEWGVRRFMLREPVRRRGDAVTGEGPLDRLGHLLAVVLGQVEVRARTARLS